MLAFCRSMGFFLLLLLILKFLFFSFISLIPMFTVTESASLFYFLPFPLYLPVAIFYLSQNRYCFHTTLLPCPSLFSFSVHINIFNAQKAGFLPRNLQSVLRPKKFLRKCSWEQYPLNFWMFYRKAHINRTYHC